MSARRLAAAALLLVCGAVPAQATTARAIFATGCFWCAEADFEKLDGVLSVVSGYTGGKGQDPTYEQVGSGLTGHAEAVEVTFDPAKIRYETLLDTFWHTHDPFNLAGQFCDRGPQYRPAIFVLDEVQRKAAEASKAKAQARFEPPLLTPIEPAGRFWPAEVYHQDYYKTHPVRYRYYRSGCGRDARLEVIHKLAKP